MNQPIIFSDGLAKRIIGFFIWMGYSTAMAFEVAARLDFWPLTAYILWIGCQVGVQHYLQQKI
jgi:hypothetical protein